MLVNGTLESRTCGHNNASQAPLQEFVEYRVRIVDGELFDPVALIAPEIRVRHVHLWHVLAIAKVALGGPKT